jgi:hypothetical protein
MIIEKFLKQNFKKIVKLQDVGKHLMAVNIMLRVLAVRSRAVEQIY